MEVALPSGVVTFLLTDVVGSTRLWETAPLAMTAALARHDDIAVHLRDTGAAALLYQRLSPFADRVIFTHAAVEGAVARPLGRLAVMLGRQREAEELFDRAMKIHEHIGSPYWLERTRSEWDSTR